MIQRAPIYIYLLTTCRTDPPVSEPKAAKQHPDATAAALAPDEPPATSAFSLQSLDHGLMVAPNTLYFVAEPMPNSSILSLPSGTAPASKSRCVAVDSYGEQKSNHTHNAVEIHVCIRIEKVCAYTCINI